MHISEGVLSAPVLLAGGCLTLAGLTIALKKMDYDSLPLVAVMAAAFFVASLIHVPLGPSNVHLILNGALGLVLGWGAVLAIFIALLLQAVLFQFGGLVVLGVNTVIMAVPALMVWMLCGRGIHSTGRVAVICAFLAGALSIGLTALLAAGALWLSGSDLLATAGLLVAAHVPIMLLEGGMTAALVGFLKKIKPEMLA
ncbi:cobalt transporter CbiM [Desulfoplanes formicivorans]|uniref:Cobalt transporter CbiM n=1 Tax=Desulfoplanes formicivorans TaxID=1592317 RepID=A0A194AIG8_9BACT|nr:cobalt transporter CbiM [Desulfoplanes formicivorans]GAU08866.1 cobalt transporter CbiM [Desulfoplanes formicivorans]